MSLTRPKKMSVMPERGDSIVSQASEEFSSGLKFMIDDIGPACSRDKLPGEGMKEDCQLKCRSYMSIDNISDGI
jgi:hypothetical protein